MKRSIQVVSNCHGILPTIKETPDLLIMVGTISPVFKQSHNSLMEEWLLGRFAKWVISNPAKEIVVIPGKYDVIFCPKRNKSVSKLLTRMGAVCGPKVSVCTSGVFRANCKLEIGILSSMIEEDKSYAFSDNEENYIKELNKIPKNTSVIVSNTDENTDNFKKFLEESDTKVVFTSASHDKRLDASKVNNAVILKPSYCKPDFLTPYEIDKILALTL